MLVKIKDILVPHDINRELLDFILADGGEHRFVVGIFIPEATKYRFYYDTVHVQASNEELLVRSQRNSRSYYIHMYAWEHVYCLMPSAKAKRKLGAGWVSPYAGSVIQQHDFAEQWFSKDFSKFIMADLNASA